MSHGAAHKDAGIYLLANRDETIAVQRAGYETRLSLIDVGAKPALPKICQIGVDISMNRNAFAALPFGSPGGGLFNEGASLSCPITMLKRPTTPVRTPRGRGALWRVISQMTRHPLTLGQSDLTAFRYLVQLHAGTLSAAARHVDGIAGLEHEAVMRRMPVKPFPAFVRGIESRLTVDETTFVGNSRAIFSRVIDRMFAPYAYTNSFVERVVLSRATGAEIERRAVRERTSQLL